MSLASLYAAGSVRRWHSNPAIACHVQTNADHQGRCVQLLLMLHPGASASLIRAMAFHDAGEDLAGDLSSRFKRAHPAVASAHAMIETKARERLCGPDPELTGDERAWMALIDGLEAACFVISAAPHEVLRPAAGWQGDLIRIRERAEALGVAVQVGALIDDLFSGDW